MKLHYDILVPGTYFCDIIFTGLPTFPALGTEMVCEGLNVIPGGTLNCVVALRRLGVHVGWVGALGNDFFSKFVLEELQLEGVETALVTQLDRPLRQVTVSLSYPQDRAFITYTDPQPDEIELLLEALERVTYRHLHFPGLFVHDKLPALLETCHAQGIGVSMDCQHHEATLDMPLAREVLSRVDMFMPNASEAKKLTCTDTLDDALGALSALVPHVVIKCGEEGAVARRDGVDYREPAVKLTPVDTTGAGDVFDAGFLAAFLDGLDTSTCLKWGNYCGGMSTLAHGPSNAPTRAAVEAWLVEQTAESR